MKRLLLVGLLCCVGSVDAATLTVKNNSGDTINVKVGVAAKKQGHGVNPWVWPKYTIKNGKSVAVENRASSPFYKVIIDDGIEPTMTIYGFDKNLQDSYTIKSKDARNWTPKQFKKVYKLTLVK
jgi:hypothetical protein